MTNIITYDPKGTGENYGIQYHGESARLLVKAIKWLVIDKGIAIPAADHHGISFRLSKFGGIRFTIATRNWSHINKGNGKLGLRFILRDESWFNTINENGTTDRVQGMLMTAEAKSGFVAMINSSGFSIMDTCPSKNSISINIRDEANFVSRIRLCEDGKNVNNNEDYQGSFDLFLSSLQEMFIIQELFQKN